MSAPKIPEKMSREELLAYVQMLEQQVKHDGAKIDFLNASVRRLEANAVMTVAALVHALGGEAIIMPNIVNDLTNYRIARTTRPEDGATIIKIERRPDAPPVEDRPQARDEPVEPMDPFVPDGL